MRKPYFHKISASSAAIAATLLLANPAMAQQAVGSTPAQDAARQEAEADRPANPTPVIDDTQGQDEVVVTGSQIRGVAPVGSNLISVGQETIEKTAPVNLSQLVNTVPSISTSGSIPQAENAFSYYSPQIHSLAGSSSNTTLVIVDGLRLPGGGQQFNQTDPNIIPVSAIQRVEVLADGASTAYGSDAVAGVVNYITRRTFDGFEMNFQQGFGKDYRNTAASFIWGDTWATGGVYIAGALSEQNILFNRDRPFTSRGDYRALGGSNNLSFSCPDATITVNQQGGAGNSNFVGPDGSRNYVFLGPNATSPTANSAANAPCNNSLYSTMVPGQGRGNVFLKVVNDFSDKLSMQFTLNYNRQRSHSPGAPGTINNLAYGAGATGGATNRFPDQINPFFVAPAGAPTATVENVNVLALRQDGNYGDNRTQADVIYGTFVANYEINDNWSITFSDAAGWNRSATDNLRTFCGACANLALNGTTQNGNVLASAVPGTSVISLNLPLNPGNALDVWRRLDDPNNRTSAGVLRSLYSNNSGNTNLNQFNQAKLDLQGSLFTLPGGDLKVAVGGEYFWQDQQQKFIGGNNTGPTTTGASYRNYQYRRNIHSVYGELYIPVVGPEMDIPFAYKIDLSIAGRYDKFSDVGDTSNPKFAANWEVTPGFKLRGNYSRAFVAPPIGVIGDPSQGYLYASGSVGTAGGLNLPVAVFPDVVNVPGARQLDANGNASSTPCSASSVRCQIGTGNAANGNAVQGVRRQLGGGFTNEVPQKGRSWSVGADFAPRFLPGFVSAVTYFHNTFIGGVSSPSPDAIVNSAGLRNLLTLCTGATGCTPEQINTFANIANGATFGGTIPLVTAYLIDQSSRNALDLVVEGVDGSFTYRTPETGIGRFTLGTAFTVFTKFRQSFTGSPDFSILNTSGFNTTFPSVQFKNRAQLGYEIGGFAADLFWNYTGAYRNWGQSVRPITRDANGNPNGGGDRVRPNNIFDLHLQYTLGGEGPTRGWQIYADIQNVFDKDPPFYNGNVGGITGAGFGYNAFVSNPLGRIASVGFRIKM